MAAARRRAIAETTGVEAHEDEVVGAVVALHDLVGDAGVGTAQIAGVEHTHAEFAHGSSRRSLTGLPSRSGADYQP